MNSFTLLLTGFSGFFIGVSWCHPKADPRIGCIIAAFISLFFTALSAL